MKIEYVFPQIISHGLIENIDNREVEDYCLKLFEKENKVMISARGNGFQSQRHVLDQDVDGVMKNLISEILVRLNDVAMKMGFNRTLSIGNYWININKKNSYNIEHVHPGSLLSAVYYAKVPKNSGNIIFFNPNRSMQDAYLNHWDILNEVNQNSLSATLSSAIIVPPVEKMLIIFPSWLYHSVDLNSSDDDRISIAFNSGVAP